MSYDGRVFLVGTIMGFAVGFSSGVILFVRDAEYVRREAVKIGVAYWASDESGRPTFEWKTVPGKP